MSRARVAAATVLAVTAATNGVAGLTERCSWRGGSPVEPASVDTLNTPIVADLNGDCFADILVVTYAGGNWMADGTLRAISGEDCSELWAVSSLGCRTCVGEPACRNFDAFAAPPAFHPLSAPAVGDIDADGDLDVIATLDDGSRAAAFEADGTFKWCGQPGTHFLWSIEPSIADLDGDGFAEVVVRDVVMNANGATATVLPAVPGFQPASTLADLDGDGRPEILLGDTAFRRDGSVLWTQPLDPVSVAADLDGDGRREVIGVVSWDRILVRDGLTGAELTSAPVPAAPTCFVQPAGAATIGDVDGDGRPEIVVAGAEQLVVFRVAGDLASGGASLATVWTQSIMDCSSGVTTSSLFDFDGDGLLDVLYADEEHFYAFRGHDGFILDALVNSSLTWTESPVAADIDGDGRAEIVLSTNPSPTGCCSGGVRILHETTTALPPARPLWNQHDYRVTNVGDDGSIPATEVATAQQLSSYRSQWGEPPSGGTAAPSLGELWPPNHRMVFVSLDGAPAIVSVTQDEPVEDLGDGTSGPDAEIVPGGVLLRAERSGLHDGRVYHIGWVGSGASGCGGGSGISTVCVPHDQRPGHACVDQGPLHDSLRR